MSIEADVERALLDRMELFTFNPVLPVSYENQDFTPPDNQAYLEVKHFPAENGNLAWGAATEHSGFLSVGVCYTAGGGTPPIRDIVGALVEHFKKGTRLTKGEAVVKIHVQPSAGSSVQDGHKNIIPVTIRYRCFAS